jgi:hypothetical protein
MISSSAAFPVFQHSEFFYEERFEVEVMQALPYLLPVRRVA